MLLATPTAGQEPAKPTPTSVEAAFLRNFARYVTWPAEAFSSDHSPWHICVLGTDPFGDVLDKTVRGRAEQGRSFEVYRAETLGELPLCHILFVAHKDAAQRRSVLATLRGRPVLTVGDAPDFLLEGGMIRFQISDRVEMSVNLDQARAASLRIQTKMLEVAVEVVENGILRRRR